MCLHHKIVGSEDYMYGVTILHNNSPVTLQKPSAMSGMKLFITSSIILLVCLNLSTTCAIALSSWSSASRSARNCFWWSRHRPSNALNSPTKLFPFRCPGSPFVNQYRTTPKLIWDSLRGLLLWTSMAEDSRLHSPECHPRRYVAELLVARALVPTLF